MHQLDTVNSNATKWIKKAIKRKKTQWDLAVNTINVEDSDDSSPFMYGNITFNQNKESVFQILQRSTLYNSNDKYKSKEEKENNKYMDIKTKQKKTIINDR